MRKLVVILCGGAAAVATLGYVAVRAQDPGTTAAKQAASELIDSQGGLAWVTKQLVAQRPVIVQQVAQVTGLPNEQAVRVTDEVFIPELITHGTEIRQAVQDAWAASFSANDLHTLRRCWNLMSRRQLASADIADINRCQASHAARILATEQPIINKRLQEAGLTFGLKWFPAAVSRQREQLRQEGIQIQEGTRL